MINNKYENIFKKDRIYSSIFSELDTKSSITDEQRYFLYAFAPSVLEFARWILNSAMNNGHKRIYFLARDGYYPYIAATQLCQAMEYDIECRYLSLSRYSLRIPEFHLMKEQCVDRICLGGIDVTFEKVMKRAGLTDAECLSIAKECGYKDSMHDILSYSTIMELKPVLRSNKHFLKMVYSHSEHAYSDTISYLRQEGLFDGLSFAIADSGWIGSIQQSLKNLIHSVNPSINFEGYYFGLYDLPDKASASNYHAFYFGPGNHILRKMRFCNCLYEAVLSAPEGMTVSYECTDNTYRPVLADRFNVNHDLIKYNQQALQMFLDVVISKKEFLSYTCPSLSGRLLECLMASPDITEAAYWGNLIFSDDVIDYRSQRVARPLTDEDIRNQRIFNKILNMLGLKHDTIHESAWIEGSIVLGHNRRTDMLHAHMYKFLVYLKKYIKWVIK
ncbi:MAG: hypothetical protein MRZ64_07520 [[Bacteroides] pectinophilus]|nr:hypothetical protein [[Bacteroides] pectinophilus]